MARAQVKHSSWTFDRGQRHRSRNIPNLGRHSKALRKIPCSTFRACLEEGPRSDCHASRSPGRPVPIRLKHARGGVPKGAIRSEMSMNNLSDKFRWHLYGGFYDQHLPDRIEGTILEFGVFKGESIRWLSDRYPGACIVGADIIPVQPDWPRHPAIRYRQVDQGDELQVQDLLASIPPPSLIIEDGSHVPSHQARCLRLGLERLEPGGIYILEDIHTSHPRHPLFLAHRPMVEKFRSFLGRWLPEEPQATPLSVLLAMEHLKRLEVDAFDPDTLAPPTRRELFSAAQLMSLWSMIGSIHVFRRSTFPTSCFRCGRTDFDYTAYRCRCGVALFSEADSMSVAIHKKPSA